ncbi:hypothetical protein Purlil1_12731 [Purpureocillium lilacinum]|uniref:Reverse transcriptase RNase H-like domain-containing protein n=1 Tax=Purpureocillium lilacinum TaxID=33203 RepID=A0ABR0BG87_PURLI|nr:hypothetical protein Purlil1_12731 [Purpureocillium lilacinum]
MQFKPDAEAQFDREIKVFAVVSKLHSLSGKAPQLVETDHKSRKLVFAYPRLHWSPLHKRATRECFDEPTLRGLKDLLYKAINELYDSGVAYPVRQDAIFLVKRSAGESRSAGQSYRWGIFLGGWQLCTLQNQADRTEWNKQRRVQLDQVDLIFDPLLAQARQQPHSSEDIECLPGRQADRGAGADLFFPSRSGEPVSNASERNSKLSQAYDDRGYWDVHERILSTLAPRIPHIHRITGLSQGQTNDNSKRKNLLSHQPTEPLSLRKTQETASAPDHRRAAVGYRQRLDQRRRPCRDRAPTDFRPPFLPHFSLNLATDPTIWPHGLDRANMRHIPLGTFSTIIIPAAYEAVKEHVRQEMPRTLDKVYAMPCSYQEKAGGGRWCAEDESYLPQCWQSIVANANQVRIPNPRGEPWTLNKAISLFQWRMLAYIDPDNVDMRSRWIAAGARDYVANAGIPERDLDLNTKRYTYLSVLRDETQLSEVR